MVAGKGKEASISLRATRAVMVCLQTARTPVGHEKLVRRICKIEGATVPVAEKLINDLRQKRILTTNLQPPLIGSDPVSYISRQLENIPSASNVKNTLDMISKRLEIYQKLADEEAIKEFEDIQNTIKTLPGFKTKSPIYVDSALILQDRELNASIGEEIAMCVERLAKLTPPAPDIEAIADYRRKYIERYGENDEVRLTELLNPEFGLGMPEFYNEQSEGSNWPRLSARDDFLIGLATENLRKGDRVRALDQALINKVASYNIFDDQTVSPSSLDVYVKIAAASSADMDSGKYKIYIRRIDTPAGCNLSRFTSLLGHESKELLKSTYDADERNSPGKTSAELNSMPVYDTPNVVLRPILSDHEILIGANPSVPEPRIIHLDELAVGIKFGRFCLKWTRGGKEIRVERRHLLNLFWEPKVAHFLHDICIDCVRTPSAFEWGAAELLPFLPRLEYKNQVIALARWKFDYETLERELHAGTATPDAFYENANLWRKKWNIPERVNIREYKESDAQVLVDFESRFSTEILRDSIQHHGKKRTILLEEMFPDLAECWVTGGGEHYASELVVPLVREKGDDTFIDVRGSERKTENSPKRMISNATNAESLGTDWVFAKIYIGKGSQDEFIREDLWPFVSNLGSRQVVKNWFFIRYSDPYPHIRLRMRPMNSNGRKRILSDTLSWLNSLLEAELCFNYSIEPYKREVARYGGNSGIGIFERLFEVDSFDTIQLLYSINSYRLDKVAVGAWSIDDFLIKVGYDQDFRLQWYTKHKPEFRGKLPGYEESFNSLVLLIEEGGPFRGGEPMTRCTFRRMPSVRGLATNLAKLENSKRLNRPTESVYRDSIHMHCNRLGLSPTEEQETLLLLLRVARARTSSPSGSTVL